MAINKRLIKSNEGGVAVPASFNTVLYVGNRPSSNNVGGVGFQPDLVWIKDRDASDFHSLLDSVRGSFVLSSNSTNAESTFPFTFTDDGFVVPNSGQANTNGNNYVAWCWKAGGAAVTNTDGVTSGSVTAVTSEVSANVDAGFSIAKFTSPASGKPSWGHGLNASPDFIIVKRFDGSQNWYIYLPSVLGQKELTFTTAAATTYPQFLSVDSSKIDLGSASFNISSNADYISYCFHSVAGFSKIGSYTGNGGTNTITIGFEPAFIMFKKTSGDNWMIIDNKRDTKTVKNLGLFPNLPLEELNPNFGVNGVEFLGNGFTITTGDGTVNASGGTYIYMAFANQF